MRNVKKVMESRWIVSGMKWTGFHKSDLLNRQDSNNFIIKSGKSCGDFVNELNLKVKEFYR